MKNVAVLVPFSEGEEQNVMKIVKRAKKELVKNDYKIFLVGPSFMPSGENLYVINEVKRKGKSFWIQKMIKRGCGIFFLISGDVLPSSGFFTKILKHFDDSTVGMVCCKVIPFKSKGVASRFFELTWLVYHRMSSLQPKGSEAITFRTSLIKKFHSRVVADEAYIESNVIKNKKRIIYEKSVNVRNMPPRSISEFISQRTRYHIGHLQVYKETGYRVASMNYALLAKCLFSIVKKRPKDIHWILMLSCIELITRIYASMLFFSGNLPYKWKLSLTSRRNT